MNDVLIVIPAYNEEANIERVVEDLKNNYPQYDYVVINDCSTDRTGEICDNRGYSCLHLPVNLGIGGGVQTGYQYSARRGYAVTVQMDGDGQHDPKYIADVAAPVLAGKADMAIGSRFLEKDGFQSSRMRRMGIGFLRFLIRVCCGKDIRDTTSGLRATSTQMTRYFAGNYAQDYPEPEAIITAVMNGYKVAEVPVKMRERLGGQSSIKAFKTVYYMTKVSLAILICRLRFVGKYRQVKD